MKLFNSILVDQEEYLYKKKQKICEIPNSFILSIIGPLRMGLTNLMGYVRQPHINFIGVRQKCNITWVWTMKIFKNFLYKCQYWIFQHIIFLFQKLDFIFKGIFLRQQSPHFTIFSLVNFYLKF